MHRIIALIVALGALAAAAVVPVGAAAGSNHTVAAGGVARVPGGHIYIPPAPNDTVAAGGVARVPGGHIYIPPAPNNTVAGGGAARAEHPSAPVLSVGDQSDGFDWGAAGIGAATILILMGLGAGAMLVTRHGRGRPRTAVTN